MVEVSQHAPFMIEGQGQGQAVGSNLYPLQSSATIEPEPNPPFVFPMLPPKSSLPVLSETLIDDHTASKRPTNRSRPQRLSVSPLPPFGFPSPNTPPAAEPCEHSPSRNIPVSRGSGHRRGGSEFIGGDGSSVGPGLMSTSPTKGAGVLPSPQMSGRRRGHAHRRSGAISNHDLSTILKPSSDLSGLRSGSAPTTPSDPNSERRFMPTLDRSASQPSLIFPKTAEPTSSGSPRESSPATVQSRPRVGFSDTLEYIPRPLSTISSATSSSISTVRPSHSLTGSITSVRSLGTSSPPSAGKQNSTKEVLGEDVRPWTAESLDSSGLFDTPSRHLISLAHRSQSSHNVPPSSITEPACDHPNQPGASFHVDAPQKLENHESRHDITQSMPMDIQLPRFQADLLRLRGAQDSPISSLVRPRSSPEAKVSKRQRKGKSWAGLLSRKVKHRDTTDHTPISNPSLVASQDSTPLDDFSLDDITFDEDTTCVIRSPDYEVPRSAPASDVATWKANILPDNEASSVLDLDATWEALDIGSRTSSGRFGSPKRRMHSGTSTGTFTSAGVNYHHRRAESAPVMAPVDHQFGLRRLGSNSQMADVSEEEEDEEGSTSVSRVKSNSTRKSHDEIVSPSPSMKVVDLDIEPSIPPQDFPRKSYDKLTAQASIKNMLSSPSPQGLTPLENTSNVMGDIPVEIVDAVDEPRFSVVTKSSDESTITPTLSSDALRSVQLPEPLEFVGRGQQQFFPPPEAPSSNASLDFAQTSFDVPRLNTARSSITDRSAWSSARTGDSGPDTSYSTEDVPSLTSSASTMISHVPFSPTVGDQPEGERSLSFSAAIPRRTRPVSAGKRSSLASLSRLVGSSYGEKSKLSIESRVQPEEGEKTDRKKRYRISRLMNFWKSKENLRT